MDNELMNVEDIDISALEEFNDDIDDNSPIPFMAFSGKTGEWKYGFEGEELEEGAEVSIGAMTLAKGFIGWKDGDVVGEHMCSIFDKKNAPKLDKLPKIVSDDPMDGWLPTTAVNVIVDGEQYVFKGSGKGTERWFKKLTAAIIKQYKVSNRFINPVITIGTTSYKHKKYGMIYTPTFQVIDWCDTNGAIMSEEEDPALENAE